MREHWTLDGSTLFLNHGSFGACLRSVIDHQEDWRSRIEYQPVRFFMRDYKEELDRAREIVAAFVGADPEGFAFQRNATAGFNAVLRSLTFEPGDEILITDHTYNACSNAARYVAERFGAKVVVAHIPFPGTTPDIAYEAITAAATDRTRLAIIDHVTSETGLILPIKRIVETLQSRGIDVLVDGAHAPGMIPVNIKELGAAYYIANLHKWCCAPRGSAFLSVRADRRALIHPLSISHGRNMPLGDRTRFRVEFDWTGTDDPTSWLCVPYALRVMNSLLPGGWADVLTHNQTLALRGRAIICDALGIDEPTDPQMIGSLASIPLPDDPTGGPKDHFGIGGLQESLFEAGIEVPVIPWPAPPKRVIRISAQLYNSEADYQTLAKRLVIGLAAENAKD